MLAVGDILQGRYRILREIGAGGMGTVYEGENLLIRRRVAIKVMREEAIDKPDLRARFELEAQIASQIPSDHITEVLDLGESHQITDRGLAELRLIRRLRWLDVTGCPQLTGAGLQALQAALPRCEIVA